MRKASEEVEAVASADGAELGEEVFVAERVFLICPAGDDLHIDLAVDDVELVFYCFDRCVLAHIGLG